MKKILITAGYIPINSTDVCDDTTPKKYKPAFYDCEDRGECIIGNIVKYFSAGFNVTLVIPNNFMMSYRRNLTIGIDIISVENIQHYIKVMEKLDLPGFEAVFFFTSWFNRMTDLLYYLKSKPKYVFGVFEDNDYQQDAKKLCDTYAVIPERSDMNYKIYNSSQDSDIHVNTSVSIHEIIASIMTCNGFVPLCTEICNDVISSIPGYYDKHEKEINDCFRNFFDTMESLKCIIIIHRKKSGILAYNIVFPKDNCKLDIPKMEVIAGIYMNADITGVLFIRNDPDSLLASLAASPTPLSYEINLMIKQACIDEKTVCYDSDTYIDYYKVQKTSKPQTLECEKADEYFRTLCPGGPKAHPDLEIHPVSYCFHCAEENTDESNKAVHEEIVCFKYSLCSLSEQEIEDYVRRNNTIWGIVPCGITQRCGYYASMDNAGKGITLEYFDKIKPMSYWLDMGFSVKKADDDYIFVTLEPEHFVYKLPDEEKFMTDVAKKIIDNSVYDIESFSEQTGLSKEMISSLEDKGHSVKLYTNIEGYLASCTITCFRNK